MKEKITQQKNKLSLRNLSSSFFPTSSQKGFTLIETVVAILILSLSLGALLTLSAGGIFSVRYARNQIVADNLNQEALEYIRNARDTEAIRGTLWTDWVDSIPSGCFGSNGCRVDPYTDSDRLIQCNATCPAIVFYPLADGGFYGYQDGDYPMSVTGITPIATTYVRTLKMTQPSTDQLVVTATIRWNNGNAPKTVTQSMLLTSWGQ